MNNVKIASRNCLKMERLLIEHFGAESCEMKEGVLLDSYSFEICKDQAYPASKELKDLICESVGIKEDGDEIIKKLERPDCNYVGLIDSYVNPNCSNYSLIFSDQEIFLN